jgi:two-component system response regulator FlrC
VIATTNRPLARWVAEGKFREDLFYRLSVLPLHLPPLRDRADDVLPLAEHLLERIARREGRARLSLTEDAEQKLLEHDWPGNVRELENLMERCAALADDDTIDARLVNACISRGVAPELDVSDRDETATGTWMSADDLEEHDGELMSEMERRLIFATLHHHGGHRARTAASLGIGLRTLGLKLKRYRELGLLDPVGGQDLALAGARR